MAQADCVVLMLASAATIRVVLLTAGSIESAYPFASRRRWGTLPEHMPEQSSSWGRRYRRSVCPVGSVFPFAESETASAGPVEKAGALKLALNQLTATEI